MATWIGGTGDAPARFFSGPDAFDAWLAEHHASETELWAGLFKKHVAHQGLTWDDRLQMGREEVVTILRKIWPYLLVGIGIGAVIHGWVPADWFATHANGPLGVPIAVALGVPLYSNAAGVVPLVEVLHDKGMPMGTVLAFMMSVVALSLPEMVLLRRVLKPRLIATFVAVVATSIVAIGYLFNLVL